MEQVTVRVPASTSNLGPGFDCLGLALRIYNQVTVRHGGTGSRDPMICAAAAKFFSRAGLRPFRFSCTIRGDVPVARGLGSSVTVRLGTMMALNQLSGRPLRRDELFKLCARLEDHPDNAAPAVFGGFNVVASGVRQTFRVSPKLKIVLLVPDFEIATEQARALLPERISLHDAAANVANSCRIVAAFASQKYEQLRGAFTDHLHQPFRSKLVPFLRDVIATAEAAGALGGFLSGSGSTIAALALRDPKPVADAMLAAANSPNAQILITSTENRGAQIVSA